MAPCIQYLYEYQNGKRVRNLGFMKVEQQMDKSVIHIYTKQIDEIKGIRFAREDGSTYFATWEDSEESEVAEIDTYLPPSQMQCEKIQRKDLSRLPRKEWRLANNSFLLHGYYNYHHLLYIQDGDEIWVGVPGVFHEKEEMAAKAFGFTTFRRMTDMDISLSTEETNTYEDFGYWCRKIEGETNAR